MKYFFFISAILFSIGALLKILGLPLILISAVSFIVLFPIKRRELYVFAFFLVLGALLTLRPLGISGEVLGKVTVYGKKFIVSELKVWKDGKWRSIPGKALFKDEAIGRVYCRNVLFRRFSYPEYVLYECYDFPLDLNWLDRLKIYVYEKRKKIEKIGNLTSKMLISDSPKVAIESGFSYVFATSGFHIGVFFFLSNLIVSTFIMNQFFRLPIALFLTFLLSLYSGPSPSAMRALLMISIWTFFKLIDYPVNRLNVLGISALISLLSDPYILLSPSFVLSYAGAFGAISAIENNKKWYQFPFVIFLYTLPFVLIFFRKVHLLTPFLSLFISPVASLMIFIGAIGSFLYIFNFSFIGEKIIISTNVFDLFLNKFFEISKVFPILKFNFIISFVLSLILLWIITRMESEG